jgi:hypothetical protein
MLIATLKKKSRNMKKALILHGNERKNFSHNEKRKMPGYFNLKGYSFKDETIH